MQLVDVSFRVGSQQWLHPLTLSLAPGMNVLLGATLAGKTTLMRLMAGLETPTTGRLFVGGQDVTGVPVRRRNLAMVYQQFINYPSLTVFENIASPLRLAGHSADLITRQVHELAERLQLSTFLERRPAELSGGQQQRIALARALAKGAQLVLLDEPLVNLDYKLREGLRVELRQLFAERETTVAYATTEPQEALQLGGHTLVLDAGRLIQHGPTLDVFRSPRTLEAARAFSDPPLNELHAKLDLASGAAVASSGIRLPLPPRALAALADRERDIVIGVRAHHLSLAPRERATQIRGRIDLAEISGSETYVHVSHEHESFVAVVPGVHELEIGAECTLYVDPHDIFCFDGAGRLAFAPA